ncbi:mitotic apparatus protein p62 [Halyomorpha halys]|uniref:mitotic apparatus protein p62 n=1 Tax=Halyomorpha halys TaxID=286706 RepID=UPI0006D501DD|nr:mitotic apparatus protein p62-like [Halyomorpha halys]
MGEEQRSYFWVTTLDSNNRKNTWDPEKILGPEGDALRREHQLSINYITVEAETRDNDVNVVEVETIGYKEQRIKFPIVIKLGKPKLMQLNLFFPHPPVTFHLVRGSGPVHLLGNHSVNSSEDEICRNIDGLDQEVEFIVVDEDEDSEEHVLQRRDNTRSVSQSNITKIRKKAMND